nr:Tripartite motif containing 37 [Polyrhizophydium stewartii]
MYYYCHTCNEGLCSDCAVIETKHKEHSIEHLHAVYKQHRARIDERAKKLYALFNDYSGLLAALNEQTAAIASTKLSMLEGYKTIWHEAVEHIERQEAIKLSVLSECKQLVSSEFDMLKRTLETLESQLSSAWQTDVIASSDEIIDLVDKLKPKSVEDFKVPLPTPDFESDIVPNYDRGTFRIRGFKALQQLSTPVYSEPIWASGLTWRLKVYCSGNGACRHECMSVFVELVSGTPVASKYQYRVELVNLSGSGPMRQRHISREFTSEFAVGECWGYNRFYSLDLLEQDGFYDPVEDAVELVYYVRAPTHISQLKKDSADVKLKTQKGSATPSGKSTARAGRSSSTGGREETIVESIMNEQPALVDSTFDSTFDSIDLADVARAGSQAIARSEEYLSSFDKFQQEMPDFESFVDTVAREVEIFESIVRKHPGTGRRYGDCDDDDEEDNDENNDMDASGFDDELDLSDARHDLLRRGASGARPISGTLVDDDDADDDDLAGQHSAADDDDSILVASYRDVGGAGGSGGNGDIDAARVDAWMTGSTSMSIDADQSIDLLNVSIGDAELDAWLMRTLSPLNRMRQMRGAQRVLGSGGLGQTDRRRQSHADADTSDELGLAEWGTLSGAPRGPGLLRHLGQLERDRAAAEASLRRFFAADDSRDDGRDNGRSTPGTDMIRGTSDGESDRGEGVDGADDGHDDEDDEPDLDDEDDGQVGRGGHDDDGEDDEDDDDVVSRRRPSWLVGRIRDGLGSRAGDDDEGDDSGDGDDDDDAVGARSPSMRRDLLSDSSRLANDTTLVGTRGQRLAHVHSSVSASPGSRSAASSRGNGLAPQQRSMQDSISTLWM